MLILIAQHELIDDHGAQCQQRERCKPLTGILTRHSKTFLNKPLKGSMAAAGVNGRFSAPPPRHRNRDTGLAGWRPAHSRVCGTDSARSGALYCVSPST